MDIRVATYAARQTTISANPAPARSSNAANGTQAARAAFQTLLTTGTEQAAPTAAVNTRNTVQPTQVASSPEGRGSIIDILV